MYTAGSQEAKGEKLAPGGRDLPQPEPSPLAKQTCLSLTSALEGLQVLDSGRRRRPLPAGAGPHSGKRKHSFLPVLGLDVHLEPIAARGPVATFLTHKELFSTVLKGLVQL